MPIVYEHPLAPSLVAPIAFAAGYGIARNRSKTIEAQLQNRANLAVGRSIGQGLQRFIPNAIQAFSAAQQIGLQQQDFALRRQIYQDRINQQWIDTYGGTPDQLQKEYAAYRSAIVTPEDLQDPNVVPQGVVLPPEEKPLSFGEFLQRRKIEIAARKKAYADALAADLNAQQQIQRYEQGIRMIRANPQALGLSPAEADHAVRVLQQKIVEARTGVTMPPPQTIRDVMPKFVERAPDGSGYFIMNPRTGEIKFSRAGTSGGAAASPGTGVMPPPEAAKLAHAAALGVVKAGAFQNNEEALKAYNEAFDHIYGKLTGEQPRQASEATPQGTPQQGGAAGQLPPMPDPEQFTYGQVKRDEVEQEARKFASREDAQKALKDLIDRYRTRGGLAAMPKRDKVRFFAAMLYLQRGG